MTRVCLFVRVFVPLAIAIKSGESRKGDQASFIIYTKKSGGKKNAQYE